MEDLSAASCFIDFVEKVHQEDQASLLMLRKLILSYQFIHPSKSYYHPVFGLVPTKKRSTKPAKSHGKDEEKVKRRTDQKRKLESGKEKEKITKKIKKTTSEVPVGVELRERMEREGGSELKLVIEKELTNSDLAKGLNRLLMPQSKVDTSFVKEEEEEKMKAGTVAVKFVEPCGDVSDLKLRTWYMNSSKNYALTSGWNKVSTRQENKEYGVFEQGNTIRVWSYRVGVQLWFTVEKVVN